MSKYLIAVSEVYRVDSEKEVESIISSAKTDKHFTLGKYRCEHKEKKVKGEVVDEWFRVQLDKVFTDEKDPDRQMEVSYHVPTGEVSF